MIVFLSIFYFIVLPYILKQLGIDIFSNSIYMIIYGIIALVAILYDLYMLADIVELAIKRVIIKIIKIKTRGLSWQATTSSSPKNN